jgi:hypothetical protein
MTQRLTSAGTKILRTLSLSFPRGRTYIFLDILKTLYHEVMCNGKKPSDCKRRLKIMSEEMLWSILGITVVVCYESKCKSQNHTI